MAEVTLVSYSDLALGSEDDRILADALAQAGANVRIAAWDDNEVDWSAGDVTIVRSTWDYHLKLGRWLSWVDRVSRLTRLVNPVGCLTWNSDKSYLLELEARGVPIVPTQSIERPDDVAAICGERGWEDVVIKPAVAASAYGAGRFSLADPSKAVAHVAALLGHSRVLIQPYMEPVESGGERSLVFIAGRFAHAFTRPAFLTGAGNLDGMARHLASPDEIDFARGVIRSAPVDPIYARVDLLCTGRTLWLMELELIEPCLGFRLSAEAARLMAKTVLGEELRPVKAVHTRMPQLRP